MTTDVINRSLRPYLDYNPHDSSFCSFLVSLLQFSHICTASFSRFDSVSGLHNLVPSNGSVVPGQSGHISDYIAPLTTITDRLLALNTKLLFGITSAFLCDVPTDDIVLEVRTQSGCRVKSREDASA